MKKVEAPPPEKPGMLKKGDGGFKTGRSGSFSMFSQSTGRSWSVRIPHGSDSSKVSKVPSCDGGIMRGAVRVKNSRKRPPLLGDPPPGAECDDRRFRASDTPGTWGWEELPTE